ncbi:MAG TPA: FKBP-type peptidyl-prolyl cis-trans isomerase [Bryobacteraceae bacterium]|jgi:FKBP-type peptidyl-prolyl cis-trans isomerase FkpA|nr:FKBP-type peptidyl-prolyl cis-trans isomerase [Bryobacteraceae bacterium]
MRSLLLLIPVALFAQTPPAAPPRPAAPKPAATAAPKPATASKAMTEDEKAIYALGLSVYKSLGQFDLSPSELEIVKQALTDAAANKPAVDIQVYGPKLDVLARERAGKVTEREKTASAAYLTKAAAQSGAVKTDSGLVYHEDRPGTGASPKATDTVKVNYRGTLVNGTEFDSSYKRNEPAQFPLNGVIRCWTEGLQKMKVGGKATLVCPSDLAYGEQGRPSIPGGAALIFQVELLDIIGGDSAK